MILAAGTLLTIHMGTATAGSYFGVDATSLGVVSDNYAEDPNPAGLRFRLGLGVENGFDLEGQFGGGIDNSVPGLDSLNLFYAGVYLKGYVPLGQRSALFAMAGGAGVSIEQQTVSGAFISEEVGFSYGFGLETQLGRHTSLTADYVRYEVGDRVFPDVTNISLGLTFYF